MKDEEDNIIDEAIVNEEITEFKDANEDSGAEESSNEDDEQDNEQEDNEQEDVEQEGSVNDIVDAEDNEKEILLKKIDDLSSKIDKISNNIQNPTNKDMTEFGNRLHDELEDLSTSQRSSDMRAALSLSAELTAGEKGIFGNIPDEAFASIKKCSARGLGDILNGEQSRRNLAHAVKNIIRDNNGVPTKKSLRTLEVALSPAFKIKLVDDSNVSTVKMKRPKLRSIKSPSLKTGGTTSSLRLDANDEAIKKQLLSSSLVMKTY